MGGSDPAPEKVTAVSELWRVSSSVAGAAVVVRLSMEASSAAVAKVVVKNCIVGAAGYPILWKE